MNKWISASLMLTIVACGEQKRSGARDDAAVDNSDASLAVETDVMGSLGGQSFRLRYGAVKRGAETDPIWVCAADIPVTYADCDNSMGPNRMMFLGPFIYDANGAPKWGLPQVWLYRVGPSPLSAWAVDGTLEVLRDDPETGALQLVLDVDFGQVAPTKGGIAIGI